MNTKVIDFKYGYNENVGILVQVILTELTIIFALIGFIEKITIPIFYFVISLLLLCMAYNNMKLYKRKYMTSIYIYIAIFVIISTVLEYYV